MNEEKINPRLSYDKELNKPKLLNDEAVLACVNYIKDKTKTESDFEVDELFLDYMAAEGYYQPSQNEVNEFVWKLVKECSETPEEELDSLGQVMAEKRHGAEFNNVD